MIMDRAALAIEPAQEERLIAGAIVQPIANVTIGTENKIAAQIAFRQRTIGQPRRDGIHRQLPVDPIQFDERTINDGSHRHTLATKSTRGA